MGRSGIRTSGIFGEVRRDPPHPNGPKADNGGAARGAEVKRCDQYLIVQDAVTTG